VQVGIHGKSKMRRSRAHVSYIFTVSFHLQTVERAMSELTLPRETYDRIKFEIESADSPVGIDAEKAHVIIIHKLMEIERRLDALEEAAESPGDPR
jgi:hypothetical protein